MTAPTKARLAALQWFHDRGEVSWRELSQSKDGPSFAMRDSMIWDNQLATRSYYSFGWQVAYTLTDAGRQALHEGTRK